MRTLSILLLLVASSTLSACGSSDGKLGATMDNPLVASRYGDEFADAMANLIIQEDPVVQENGMTEFIQAEIRRGKKIAGDARDRMRGAMMGALLPIKADVSGFVLHTKGTLYFSPDFFVTPGPDLHVYLTEVTDPRDAAFPDVTAIDLGSLLSAYGAKQYEMPKHENPKRLRTLVIFDEKLKFIVAMAQLSEGV